MRLGLVHLSFNRRIVFDLVILLLLAAFVYWKVLDSNLILRLDLEFPLDLPQAVMRNFYAWDPLLQLGRDASSYVNFPFYSMLAIPSVFGISVGAVEKFVLIFSLSLSGWSMYYLSHYLTKGSRFVCFVSSLFYMFNPWIIDRILWGHLMLILGYSVVPLALVLFIKSLDSKSFKDFLMVGLALSLLIILDFRAAYIVLGVMLFYFVFWFVINIRGEMRKRKVSAFVTGIKLFTIALLVVLILNAYWLLPSANVSTGTESVFASADRMWIEDLDFYSASASVLNVVRLRYFAFSFFETIEGPYFANPLLLLLSFGAPFLAFFTLILRPKDKWVIFFSSIGIAAIFLSIGINEPFGIFQWLWLNVPGFVAFRDMNKFISLICLAYAYLIGVSINNVFERFKSCPISISNIFSRYSSKSILKWKYFKYFFIFLTLTSVLLVNSWPMFTGNFSGYLENTEIPNEYLSVYDWLSSQKEDFRILLIPFHYGVWVDWATEHLHNPYYISPPKPVILGDAVSSQYTQQFVDYLQNVMRARSMSEEINLGKVLAIANIKYIILHTDTKSPSWFPDQQQPEEVLNFLLYRSEFELVRQEGKLYVFENRWFTPHILATSSSLFVTGSRDALGSLSALEETSFNTSSIFFTDQFTSEKELINGFERSSAVLFHDKSFIDLVFLTLNKEYEIVLSQYVGMYKDAGQNWVRGSFYPVISDLKRMGEYFSEQDFIYTTGTNVKIDIPTSVKESQEYDLWLRLAYGPLQSQLLVQMDDVNLLDVTPFEREFSGFQWIKAGAIHLSEGNHALSLTNYYGETSIDKVALVPHSVFNTAYDLLFNLFQESDKRIIYSLNNRANIHPPGWIDDFETGWIKEGDVPASSSSITLNDSLAISTVSGVAESYTYAFKGRLEVQASDYSYLIFRLKGSSNAKFSVIVKGIEFDWSHLTYALSPRLDVSWVSSPNNYTTYIVRVPEWLYGKTITEVGIATQTIDGAPATNYWDFIMFSKTPSISAESIETSIFVPRTDTYLMGINIKLGAEALYAPGWMDDTFGINWTKNPVLVAGAQNYTFSSNTDFSITTVNGVAGSYAFSWNSVKNLSCTDYPFLTVRVSGTENAKFTIIVKGNDFDWTHVPPDWMVSPQNYTLYTFRVPEWLYGKTITEVGIFTQTIDGAPATNYWDFIMFSKTPNILSTRIGGTEFIVKNLNVTSSYVYVGPVDLNAGLQPLSIEVPSNSNIEINGVYIYSIQDHEKNLLVDDLFSSLNINTPTVVNFTQINPTKYLVHLKVDEPFFLIFSETFNPLWVAHTNDKEFEHHVAYSFLNGYYIDSIGEFDIIIEYTPQNLREIGFLISGIGLFLIIFYSWVWTIMRGRKHEKK